VDRVFGPEGLYAQVAAELLVPGGGHGLPQTTDDVDVLEHHPDGEVAADTLLGLDVSKVGVNEVLPDVAVGEGRFGMTMGEARGAPAAGLPVDGPMAPR
jgi:hypothetical protein